MSRSSRVLASLVGLCVASAAFPQSVTVRPYEHRHTFLGGGAGVTLYPNHLIQGTSASLRTQAYDWLFRDLDNTFVRISFNDNSEPVNDNADPLVPDMSVFPRVNIGEGIMANEAKRRNPRTEFIPWAQDIPLWLRDANGDPDYSNPDLFLEIAEWWYMNLVDWKINKGLEVRYLDVANEPDFNGFWGRSGVEQLLLHAVPALRNLVTTYQSTYGVPMPQIIAASCLGTNAAANYMEHFRNNVPAAWDNIDVCSTHQYGAGFNAGNYQRIESIRGSRGFFMTEMHTYHQSVLNNSSQSPPDSTDDEVEAALIYGRLFSLAVNGGCEAYCYFMANTPSRNGFVGTQWNGTPTRRKVYFAARHLTSLQTPESSVVSISKSGMPSDLHVIAFHKGDESTCVVTVTNPRAGAEPTPIQLVDSAGTPIAIRRVTTYETDGNSNLEVVDQQVFSPSVTSLATASVPALAMRSFVIEFEGRGAFETFGTGCVGSVGAPSLVGSGGAVPRIGQTFQLTVGNFPLGSNVFGVLGFDGSSPLDLGLLGANGCSLYTNVVTSTALQPTLFFAFWGVTVPDSASLAGVEFLVQAVVIDPPANSFGLTTSNAGRALVGF